jgi:hypothetical protein
MRWRGFAKEFRAAPDGAHKPLKNNVENVQNGRAFGWLYTRKSATKSALDSPGF